MTIYQKDAIFQQIVINNAQISHAQHLFMWVFKTLGLFLFLLLYLKLL